MDNKTRSALERSIEHWKQNAAAEVLDDVSVRGEDCALCGRFYDSFCKGCPVAAKTGKHTCLGTPYHNAASAAHVWDEDPENEDLRGAFRAAALKEVAFLESLREDPS